MQYRILIEPAHVRPGESWTDTGETFEGAPDEAQAQVEALQAEFGACFAAQATGA
jgi:hypothetical protein